MSEFAALLADHGARINSLESGRQADRQDHIRTDEKIDKVLFWMMTTLVTVAIGVIGIIVTILTHR